MKASVILLAPDRRTAEKVAKEINLRIIAGTFQLGPDEQVKTFKEYADIFLSHCTVKPGTKYEYVSMLNRHILPVFGKKPVDNITRLDVKNFLKKKLADGLTISTVNHYKACLCNVFDCACDDEAIPNNPASRIGRIAKRDQDAHTSGVKAKIFNQG